MFSTPPIKKPSLRRRKVNDKLETASVSIPAQRDVSRSEKKR